MNKFLICLICGKKYYGFHTSKTCSLDCRKKSRKIIVDKYLKKIKEKKKNIKKLCLYCNNQIKNNNRKFCSLDCKKQYNKKSKIKKIKKCKICGEKFIIKSNLNIVCEKLICKKQLIKKQDKKYREKRKNQKKKEYIHCKYCKQKFIKNHNYKYCSIICRKKQEHIVAQDKCREKYTNDILYRLRVITRTRFKRALNNKYKIDSPIKLIGCSIIELKKHIEKNFKSGMSWNNYNFYSWHIDHIKPCAMFDLTNIEEQKKCFHYTNLQPLWAKENLRKNSRIK